MNQQFIYLLKVLSAVIFTTFLLPSSFLKSQNSSKKVEITDQNGNPTVIYEESHALVIWVGNYKHWNKLNNVETEAKQVINILEKQGFKVTTVGNPTGENLRNAIKNFIDNHGYKSNNRLVIFFTGHGYTRNETKGYLIPVDSPDPIINEQDFLKYAFPMQQMISWARLIEAKHALFVFDSCFSGTVFKTKAHPRLENAYIRDVIAKPVRQFIAAGDADQEVPAKSIFTPLFIRGLKGEADYTRDGYVTGSELGLYLTQTLRKYTSDQTPQYGKIRDVELDQGDIVFRSLGQYDSYFQKQIPIRPIHPGISVSSNIQRGGGTICCIVQDKQGQKYILSDENVFLGKKGTSIIQPGWIDGGRSSNKIAVLTKKLPIAFNHPNRVAGAIARLEPEIQFSSVIPDIGQIEGIAQDIKVGQTIISIGRTSGIVEGKIIATEVETEISRDPTKKKFQFQSLIKTTPIAQPGDSGAPVLIDKGDGKYQLVGMVYAGSRSESIVIPIKNILDALEVELYTAPE